ncbi:hypothetical protein Tco_1156112 [Tanacetum coccineum]
MNSNHCKKLLSKLAAAKRIQLCSSSEKIQPKVSWVKIKKYLQQVYDPCTAEFLKTVKPWVEDTSRVLQSMDTVWLSDDIERFLGQSGQIKCKFPWNDDYIVDRNFWLKLVCLDPVRKGWLTEETPIAMQALILCLMGEVYHYMEARLIRKLRLLQKFQQDDLESSKGMMRLICETQLKFVRSEVQLPRCLERAIFFQRMELIQASIPLRWRMGCRWIVTDDHVDVAWRIERRWIDDSIENYSLFEVNYDGMFNELPLRYAYGKVLPLKLSNSNRMTYSEILDMLVYKLECEIRALFYSIPRNSLETGFTIVECDNDVKKIYDTAELYGLINLYISHFPRNLASYYFKNLTFDEAHGDIQSKVTSHEKLKSHGNLALMTFDEGRTWEKEQSISPLLRTEWWFQWCFSFHFDEIRNLMKFDEIRNSKFDEQSISPLLRTKSWKSCFDDI